MADTNGRISMDVTETCWTTVSVDVNEALLKECGCTDLVDLRNKIRTGVIDLWSLDPKWEDPYDSRVEYANYECATAIDRTGKELEVPDDW
jgi:hypothetical protein